MVFVLEAAFVVAVYVGISAYQTRNLLETDGQAAPPLQGTTLSGQPFGLADRAGRPVLVYFFAPWCVFCAASSDNVERLRRLRDPEALDIVVVALDWSDKREVEEYVRENHPDLPVVLGEPAVASDWQVQGFPTYYVLDSMHRIVRRDFGYSTQFGLWWRTWWVE